MSESSRNGVNVQQLMDTIGAIKSDPALAQFQFRAKTHWQSGAHVQTQIQDFYGVKEEDHSRAEPFVLEGDEPSSLLGRNLGANAVELLLAGINACLSVGIAYNAAARGITIEQMSLETAGDIDLQGFLGISREARPGCQSIQIICRIKSEATDEQLGDLLEHVQNTSPVTDMIRHPTPVQITTQRVS